jgi:hypothetical protein
LESSSTLAVSSAAWRALKKNDASLRDSLGIAASGAEILADYEQMRSTVLDPSNGLVTLQGLALFLRQGMAAWMSAGSHCMRGPTQEPDRAATRTPPQLPPSSQAQLVTILAGMILSQHREITT